MFDNLKIENSFLFLKTKKEYFQITSFRYFLRITLENNYTNMEND